MATIARKRAPALFAAVPVNRPRAMLTGTAKSWRGNRSMWIDTIQVNPVNEPPRLIFQSGFQPFVRWGRRRFELYGMTAGIGSFLGRYFYAGKIMNRAMVRDRIVGVPARGWTYQLAAPDSGPGPRTVRIGGGLRRQPPAVGR